MRYYPVLWAKEPRLFFFSSTGILWQNGSNMPSKKYMSNEKNLGWLFYIDDYVPTQFYGDYNKPWNKNPYYNNHGDYSHFHPHKDSEIPKQKLLFRLSGVSSRGIWVRSYILDAQFIWKMLGKPLGWRDPARCLTPLLKPFKRGYGPQEIPII